MWRTWAHKRAVWLAAAALLALLCTCTGYVLYRKHRTVELEFAMFVGSNWGVANAHSYTIVDKAIAQFEREHKNVRVVYSSGILKEDYSEWFSRKVLAGNPPDVFMVLSDDFNQFSALGVLKNLDHLMASDAAFDPNAFYANALNTGKYHGEQYALPYEIVPTLMFVNKSLLLREGIQVPAEDWTWNDLYDICRRVTRDTDGNGLPDQFGTYNYDWRHVVPTNGASLFDADGRQAYFTDERVAQAVKFSKQIYDLNQGQKVTQEDFDKGRVAFMPLLFAEYRTYKTYPYRIKKYTHFQWDCITLPAGKNGGNISEVDTLLMGIGSRTRHEALAWEFLKLLTYNEEIQMDIFRYSQGASVLRSVTNSREAEAILQEDMEEGERVIDNELLSRVIEEGVIAPKFKKYDDIMVLADNEINKIMEADKSIDSVLKRIQRTANRSLK